MFGAWAVPFRWGGGPLNWYLRHPLPLLPAQQNLSVYLAATMKPSSAAANATVPLLLGQQQHPPVVAEGAQYQTEEALQNCFESEGFVKFQFTVDDLLLAATTASTLFNVLVIVCAFRLFKRSGDTMHVFIINMTFGDLLLTVFCHPNEFLIRKHEFLRHVGLCSIIHFCNWIGLAVSGLSLTLLNVDKLIYFRWPLSYERAMSKRRAICLCGGVWIVSLGFVSYVWAKKIVFVTPVCMLQMAADNSKYFYEIFMILFCVLPVSSSLVVSTYLFQLTRQKLNAPAISQQQLGVVDMPTFKNKLKSLVFIFATTVWTSFSLLPYRIFNICRLHLFDWPNIGCDQRVIMNWVAWVLLYLLTLNPIINPLITALIYAPYRIHLKNLLLNIPGNRLQYSSYRTGEITEHSQISSSRRRNKECNDDLHVHRGQRGEGESSTTTSSSSHLPPFIPLAHIAYNKNSSVGEAHPPQKCCSAKSPHSPKSATAMFIFVDAESEAEEGQNDAGKRKQKEDEHGNGGGGIKHGEEG